MNSFNKQTESVSVAVLLRDAMQMISKGDHASALSCIEQARLMDKPLQNVELLRAFSLMGLNRFEEAYTAVENELDRFPNNEEASNLKAQLLKCTGGDTHQRIEHADPEKAVNMSYNSRESEIPPSTSRSDLLRGAMRNISEGKFEEALEVIERTSKTGVPLKSMELLRAISLMRLRRVEEAETAVDRELALFPDNEEARALKIQLEQINKDTTSTAEPTESNESETDANRHIVKINLPEKPILNDIDNSEDFINTLELLLVGDVQSALLCLNKVKSSNGRIRGLDYIRAMMLNRLGRSDEAIEALKEELKDDLGNIKAGRLLQSLQVQSIPSSDNFSEHDTPKLWHEIASFEQGLICSESPRL